MTNHNSNTLSSTVSSKKAATRSTSLKISHKSEMTFAEQVEAGMNPYEDILVESLLYESKQLNDAEFEYVAMLQLARLNLTRHDLHRVLDRMTEYLFDDIDDFLALTNFDITHSIDRHVAAGLHINPSDLDEPIDALAEKYHGSMYELKMQLKCALDLCRTWKHFQTICKRVGLNANSQFVTEALKFAHYERAMMRL